MAPTRRCRQCSVELPEVAFDELCVRCRSAATVPEGADGETTIPADAADAGNSIRPTFTGLDLGPVRLLGEIGRGGMGVVFRGHDRVLGRDVAVKFLPPIEGPDDPALTRFLEEARHAAAAHHPGLTQIYHADIAAGRPYLVLQYVDGPSLRELIRHRGPLPPRLVVAVMEEVSEAVDQLHMQGILHRDLKPGNILLNSEGGVFVTDFGLALGCQPGMSSTVAGRAGSLAYMAPETFEGRFSPRSDAR